jgi:sigma-B regulation protein RsbU (phosphoserine phosphatase)
MSQLNSEYDFEHAPCGYLSFYPDGTIIQINQTLLNWIHYKKEEVVGIKKLDAITSKGTSLYFQVFVYPLLKMQGYINELSVNIVASDNTTTSCLFNASAIKSEDGSLRQIHAILFSIAERKSYEAEILQAKQLAEAVADHKEHILQAQRRILFILGHDTRAPLYSINMMIKLAAEGKIGQQEIIPFFERMANQLDVTLILLADLLSWSDALLNNKKKIETLFPLQDVVREVFDLLEGNANAKGIYLKSEVDSSLTMNSNRQIITFIIRNLVNNSIKYTSKGGVTVTIKESAAADTLIITVKDTGEGMPPEKLKKYVAGQLSSTAGTNNEQGSGMGMALIKEFLLQLNGSIQAESHPGIGTSTIITLPGLPSNSYNKGNTNSFNRIY